jgi:DNA-3-methyladenine glycosylase II
MKRLIAAIGPCTLQPDQNHFAALVRAIIAQQISTKAARSIQQRLLASLAPGELTAPAILAAPEGQLRTAGLSLAKARSVRDLAEKVHQGVVRLDTISQCSDEEVISQLVPVRGIGRWTAEMFLIFSLGRSDVLPLGDLGLRVGAQRQYGLEELPGRTRLVELAEPWRPYRSIATWYLWRSLGSVPQSEGQGK